MWTVEPDTLDNGKPQTAIIHLDTVVRLAHLLPIYGEERAPRGVKYTSSLDVFSEFYVNKFEDNIFVVSSGIRYVVMTFINWSILMRYSLASILDFP